MPPVDILAHRQAVAGVVPGLGGVLAGGGEVAVATVEIMVDHAVKILHAVATISGFCIFPVALNLSILLVFPLATPDSPG